MSIEVRSEPFPHFVHDGMWLDSLLDGVLDEFPPPQDHCWRRYDTGDERKLEGPPLCWGIETRALFDLLGAMGPWLSNLFNIPDLSMETIGGGYHFIEPGGYLRVHTDFNRSPDTALYRRLNLIVFLNRGWQRADGGLLELWDDVEPQVVIEPEFGRMVVFETSDRSWHGHPTPTRRERRSVAAYFFSPEAPPGYKRDHSTNWHPFAEVR